MFTEIVEKENEVWILSFSNLLTEKFLSTFREAKLKMEKTAWKLKPAATPVPEPTKQASECLSLRPQIGSMAASPDIRPDARPTISWAALTAGRRSTSRSRSPRMTSRGVWGRPLSGSERSRRVVRRNQDGGGRRYEKSKKRVGGWLGMGGRLVKKCDFDT